MGSVVIVVVDVVLQGFAALLFRRPRSDVGPFFEQGAVEALDFAVGLGPVGAGVFGFDAEPGAGLGP